MIRNPFLRAELKIESLERKMKHLFTEIEDFLYNRLWTKDPLSSLTSRRVSEEHQTDNAGQKIEVI